MKCFLLGISESGEAMDRVLDWAEVTGLELQENALMDVPEDGEGDAEQQGTLCLALDILESDFVLAVGGTALEFAEAAGVRVPILSVPWPEDCPLTDTQVARRLCQQVKDCLDGPSVGGQRLRRYVLQ